MKIKKEDIKKLLLFLIGVFCQINPLMSRGLMVIYLGLCSFLFLLSIDIKKLKISKGLIWYGAFVTLCLISLSYTINTINPDFVYARILIYLYLLILSLPFLYKRENIETVVKGFIIGGLIGITVVLTNQYSIIGQKRLGGNIYGSYAEFGAVCSLTMTSFIFLQKKIKIKNFLKIIIFAYILLAIMLSGARKALLISILIPLFLQMFDKRKKMHKKFMILFVLSIFSILVVYISLNNEYLYKFVGKRIESGISSVLGEEKDDASLYERNSFKKLAKQMFKEKPITGWGIHSFALKNYYNCGKLLYSHDGFLEILSCYGLIGFIFYYWIFVYVFVNYKKLLYDDVGIFLFSYMITILLMELYSISFFNSFYLILIGACVNIIERGGEKSEKFTKNNIQSVAR